MPKAQQTTYQKVKARAEQLHKRITADTEEYNRVISKLQLLRAVREAKVGTLVGCYSGRGSSVSDRTGEVLGIKQLDNDQVQLRLLVGEGVDATVVDVHEARVHSVTTYSAEVDHEEPEN